MRVLKKIRQQSKPSDPPLPSSRGRFLGINVSPRGLISLLAVLFILSAIGFNTVLAIREEREQTHSLRALQTSGQMKRDLDELQQMMLDEHGDLYTSVSTRAFYPRAAYQFPLIPVYALTTEARSFCGADIECMHRFNDLDAMIAKLAARSNDIAQLANAHPGSVKLDNPTLSEIDAYFYAVLEKVVEVRMSVDSSIDSTVSKTSADVRRVSNALFASAFTAASLLIALLLWNVQIAGRLKRHEEKLRRQANYDALTTLPNRSYLQKQLNALIAEASNTPSLLSILFIDLDRFKQVNDSFGHAFGDALLAEMSSRLKKMAAPGDLVGRYGGDEFIIIAKRHDAETVRQFAEQIVRLISRPVRINDHELFIDASIGVSNFPIDGPDADTLIRNADTAMYLAKSEGRNGYRFFRPELSEAAAGKLHLSMRLRRAVIDDSLSVVYQPQVNMATGQIVGVEALLRWSDEELGIVSPAVFIQIAEDIGVIHLLGEQVLRKACQQAKEWHKTHPEHFKVSVNVSPVQLAHTDFLSTVQMVLHETGCPVQMLELEVTEGALMRNVETVAQILQALRSIGVTIAIDDFGTGYSSLSYLKRFSIDRIKIDRAFVQEIGRDSSYEALTIAIIAIAEALEFDVIAEGVENEFQKSFLLEKGCSTCQGFLYSRAIAVEQISEQFLNLST